jgi:hypothetical protein
MNALGGHLHHKVADNCPSAAWDTGFTLSLGSKTKKINRTTQTGTDAPMPRSDVVSHMRE